ncbi:hypothetical protein RUM43_002773 [Polyplax serrata]|uniref:Bestrophin homolog n=1 Tax=Polyplax serrata TaxID=468196 RepID=A0AAN8S997_POLSC
MSLHCQVYGDLIPVSFVLGFYVSVVIKRWWDQYLCLPWPDNLALFVSSLVHGQDERGRIMRRTIMRYVNLSLLLTLRMISPRVKKRFPTLDHVVEAGWMLPGEKKIFEDLEHKTPHTKYWMPLVWAGGIVTRARKENRIKDDFALKTLIDELNIFRGGCGGMLNYDWISIPLVYTQVVTLAVYVFFLSTLMGNQYLDPSKGYAKHQIDLFLPVFTFLQFFFYMGWLKVAESLVNPFGEDDDDFELNWLLDRNLQISYVIVDEMHQEHPEMLKDQYWDEVFPVELPYTAAAKQYQTGPPQHSAEEVEVPSHQAEFMPLDSVVEDKMEESGSESGEDIDIQMEHPSVQRGETHPMKIKRRSRTSSRGTTSASEQSSLSSKGKSSVLNLLSRIFHHKRSSKEEVNQLGSSASLRSRRGNRSTSRISSVSHSMAPSRSSFVKESIPYNDFQLEVFTMSDLDIPNSGLGVPEGLEHKSVDVSRSSLHTNGNKTDAGREIGDTIELEPTKLTEHGFKKESKIPYSSVPQNIDKKEISPNQIFPTDFCKRESIARVVVQSNSPVYHVFAPVNSTAFVPSVKFPLVTEPAKNFDVKLPTDPTDKDGKEVNRFTTEMCPESLITILPPAEAPRFGVSNDPSEKQISEKGVVDSPLAHSTASLSYLGSFLNAGSMPGFETAAASPPKATSSSTVKPPVVQTFFNSPSSYTESTESKDDAVPPLEIPLIAVNDLTVNLSSEVNATGVVVSDGVIESVTTYTDTLTGDTINLTKVEELEVSAPDPSTPSAAIPVPALSQAHATSVDLEIGRRPMMHELEPIIEHRDEGTSSLGSSISELNSAPSLSSDNKKVEVREKT